ncbi:MAG: right-handed parallel beta-helix repeat-containing protein [Phycisphaerae bacterium]|nr:right-handed parallel beta-helix repeat-containing protein [Phycisphaerae bacterium]
MSLPAARANDIHVATNGRDTWSGTLPASNAQQTDGPLATLKAARDAARKIDPAKPRRIVVHDGAYYLSSTLALEPADSGLTIVAARDANPVLYGGRTISGWTQEGYRSLSADVPDLDGKPWDFRMLVVDGNFRKRARLPESGVFKHLTQFKVPWMGTTGGGWKRKPTTQELTTMTYRPADLSPWLDANNAEITVYHMWDESVVGVASIDTKTNTLTFSTPTRHPPGAFGVMDYVVWNVLEGMTRPGQWFLDRSARKLCYWPVGPEAQSLPHLTVIAPTIQTIIRLQGKQDAPVRNVTVRGLSFSVTNTPLKAGGFGAGMFEGAVSAVHSEDCRMENLHVFNVGGQGIRAWQCTGLVVERCHVHDTGACGIKVGGTGNVIADNHVHDVGVLYPSAIGVWGQGKRAEIRHNEIHDTPYTAVACGGDAHRIESNLIYRAMQELRDGGGIYVTMCKQLVIRGNLIRDIAETGGYGSSAYYLDEQAEACLVEDNVSLRVPRPSHNHMAKKNAIRHNLFVCDGDAKLTFPKSADFRFDKNVIRASGKITFSNPKAITESAANVIFSQAGSVTDAPQGAVQADPKLTGLDSTRIGFADGSPALAAGIEPFDVTKAGRRNTAGR